MNKKLLLSFAAFATALTVNAQKTFTENEVSSPIKVGKEDVKRTDISGDKSYYYWENNSRYTSELNKFLGATGGSDGGFDTLGLYTYKFKEKTTTATYWQQGFQMFPSTDEITLNSVRFVGSSLNPNGADIVFKVLAKDYSVLATKTLNVTNSYGYKTVTFDTPVTSADTIYLTFGMNTVADSFQVAQSHSIWNNFNFGTAQAPNVFNTALPFTGDAKLYALTPDYASLLGGIKKDFDFFLIPSFTYKVKADFQASASSICLGDSVAVKNMANTSHLFNPILNYIHWDYLANGNRPAYTWFDFGNGKDYSDSLSSGVVFSTTGIKQVMAKVMLGTWTVAPFVFEDSTELNIIVNELPEAKVTVTEAKCSGDKASVLVEGSKGASPYTGAGSFEVAAVAGSIKYAIVDDNNCKSDSVSATILDAPSAIALDSNAVIASNDVTADGKAIVIATGGTAPYSYSWDGNNETNDTIIVGKGSYKVTVKDANECSTFATITVGAGTAAVADLAIKGLAIYPNPVASQLFVSFNANSAATVELLNVAGQVIESKNTTNVVNASFNTEKLTSGVYFVSIKVAEGTFTQKVIKD